MLAEAERLIAYRDGRCRQATVILDGYRAQIAAALRLVGSHRRKALTRVQLGLDCYVWPVADRDGRDPGFADAARILSDEIGRAVYGDRLALDTLTLSGGRPVLSTLGGR